MNFSMINTLAYFAEAPLMKINLVEHLTVPLDEGTTNLVLKY
jgi:hypothetical protein